MKRVSSLRLSNILRSLPLAALGASFLLTLSGCPGGAELEHPEKYGLTGGNSATGSGGTGATGGTSGTGGTTGGSAGTGTDIPPPTVDCGSLNYTTILTQDCATPGCHRGTATTAASGLVLTPDNGLVGRLKDVTAKHGDIYCTDVNDYCVPATCDMSALLVNSAAPDKSWILTKLRGTQNGCGDQMPSSSYDSAKEQCLEKMVNAIAALSK